MTPLPKKSSDRFRRILTPLLTLVTASVCSAQTVAPAPAQNASQDEDVIILSPFVVDATQDKGYYAANTLAGSRMKTNLSDLGASISVITKQQMDDTASTDINDIFRYEVNTEGALTYTPGTQSFRNDGVLDVNAGGTQGNSVASFTVAGANRVRGLGAPSAAINYYQTNGALPFDSYNTQSVEISRGPNSMLFGLGSPAGIANQSTASAQMNRDNASVSFRTDQYGSFRSSLNFNRSLIRDKLALYGAAVYDHRRFDRDPSYDKTKRFYGAITFKPFKKTTIKANIEKYDNDNHRPNTLTPRDYVTQWNLAGQPYYDPVTRMVKSLQTGNTLSMMVNNNQSPFAQAQRDFVRSRPGYDPAKRGTSATVLGGTDTTFSFYNGAPIFGDTVFSVPVGWKAGTPSPNILYTPGIGVVNQGRSIQQIADGQLVNWFQPTYQYKYRPQNGTPTNPAANPTNTPSDAAIYANPAWAESFTRTYTSSAPWTAAGNGIFANSYRYPSVTDRSIYDWRSINLNSMNFGSAKNTNYNIELEQELPWNLFLNAGWFRQDFAQRTNYTVAQLNVSTLFVDTNIKLPDGTANPYFGKPYLEDQDPDSYYNASLDDHYRAMLAWTPDFTQKSGWLKWLGRHQVLGMWSSDKTMATSVRQRLQYISSTTDAGRLRYLPNPNNNADGTPSGWNRGTGNSLRRTYYLASPSDPNGVVTRSAGYWDHMSYTGDIKVYDYNSSGWQTVNVTQDFHDIDAGTGRNERIIKSLSGGITSYLWDNRLVATFGVRKDEYKARITNTGLTALRDAAGNIIEPAIINQNKWVNGEFQRDLAFNRWGTYGELSGTTRTLGGVLRPFQGWSSVENRASGGSGFWQFVRSLGVSYNKSDNFNPPSNALGDFFGVQLPKPTGDGKDYGFQFSLLDNKLFARVTWFEASNLNENISAPVVFSRLSSNIDETLFRTWAYTIARINSGDDPRVAAQWDDNPIVAGSAKDLQLQAAAEVIWKLPYNYYGTSSFARGATRNAAAKGVEAEINYNPTKNWTMKFTFGKQDTKYASVLKEFTPWNDVRMPVWTAAKASDYLLPQYQSLATYTTPGSRQVVLTNFWSSFGYQSSVFPENANAFDNPQDAYNGVVSPQLAFDRDLQGQSVPGQRKYRWSFLSSYTFSEGRFKGFSVGGNLRWEDKAVIGYYGKASGANLFAGAPVMDISDVTKPIYDSANYYTDVYISYRRKIANGRVGMKIQLNVGNVFESGTLRPVAVNYDGSPYSFRIIDPRLFQLTTTFDF